MIKKHGSKVLFVFLLVFLVILFIPQLKLFADTASCSSRECECNCSGTSCSCWGSGGGCSCVCNSGDFHFCMNLPV